MGRTVKAKIRALLLLSIAACAAPHTSAPLPKFAPPVHGVFQTPVPLVAGTEDDLLPSLSMAQGRMAYAANTDGNLDIYVRPLSGGAPERLTTASTSDTDPAFSPSGDRIAWVAQAEDVKGDIWVMNADGSAKRRLTSRATADAAPAWRPDGRAVYFTSRVPGSSTRTIESVDVVSGERHTVVTEGWDPAPAPDGTTLFYVRLENHQARVFARRLSDGREVPLTAGGAIEALPRAGSHVVVLVRYMDDQTGDGVVDVDDIPSLWGIDFDAQRFEGAPPAPLRPLTAGQGGELFASVSDGWLVYTAARSMGLEIDALPLSGIMDPNTDGPVVLDAARAQDNPALRRLALRHLVATRPALVATAQYELARELAERQLYRDAITTLDAAIQAAAGAPLAMLARVEQERLRTLQGAQGAAVSLAAIHTIITDAAPDSAATVRARVTQAEFALLASRHGDAVNALESVAVAPGALAEDRARALDLLGGLYDTWHDFENVARVCEATLRQVPGERYYAQRAAERWVTAAQNRAGVPPMAALESLVHAQADLPQVAARAAVALARAQEAAGHADMALLTWENVVAHFGADHQSLRTALLAVAQARRQRGDTAAALAGYEQLLRDFTDGPEAQAQARRGIAALGLAAAEKAEAAGKPAEAYALYERLLQSNSDTVQAQRRRLALGAELGHLPELLAAAKSEANAKPRDKYAQYALGYAYTLTTPPSLSNAEAAMNRVLELDPRFPAAHLTQGWIRQMRDIDAPGQGWLEKAVDSAETARTLLDPNNDAALWGAATLNKGNALFALGKSDEAFAALMAREVMHTPFESPLREVLFHETLSRVALRVGELGVALDQATQGFRQTQHLPGAPREAALTGLLASLNMQAGRYAAALPWYERAIKRDQQNQQWDHLVPMLRGKAMTQQALGEDEAALATVDAMLAVLAEHDLPKDLALRGLAHLLPRSMAIFTIPADFTKLNITAAEYGFNGNREEEIAHSFTARLTRRHGDVARARQHDARRLSHVRRAYEQAEAGQRLGRLGAVLVGALHESALLALDDNDASTAAARWREAIPLCAALRAWDTVATLASSWLRLRALDGAVGDATLDDALRDAFVAAQADPAADGAVTAHLGRLQALLADQAALHTVAVEAPLHKPEDWQRALNALDAELQRQRAARAALGWSPSAPAPPPKDWRALFDRSLWDADPHWLAQAAVAYSADGNHEAAPELGAFLGAATQRLLDQNHTEEAWKLLERSRLRSLVPLPERQPAADMRQAWERTRAARGTPTYAAQLAAGPALVAALEGEPVDLTRVREALPAGTPLVQVFAPTPSTWHWFVHGAAGLQHVATAPLASDVTAWPATVTPLLPQDAAPVLLDSGELTVPPPPGPHARALSATYWVACHEARTLARGGVLAAGGSVASQAAEDFIPTAAVQAERLADLGANRTLVHLAVPGRAHASRYGAPAQAQILFGNTAHGAALDLDRLAGLTLQSAVALVTDVPTTRRTERALVQSLLFAGIPTVVVGQPHGPALRQTLARADQERVGALFVEATRGDKRGAVRLWGEWGMSLDERVSFALQNIMHTARGGADALKRANAAPAKAAWQEAADQFEDLIDTVDFLMEEGPHAQLLVSTEPLAKKITPALANLRFQARSGAADAYIKLGDLSTAVAMRRTALDELLRDNKNIPLVLITQQNLGKNLEDGKRFAEAAEQFAACAALAQSQKQTDTQVACLGRLGNQRRALYDYGGAEAAYRDALAVLHASPKGDAATPHELLGKLYETALSNYAAAETEFQAALAAAQRPGDADAGRIPELLIALARVSRTRGDYAQALTWVAQAEALPQANDALRRADALLEEAKIHWYRGNYRRAENRQQAALALAERIGTEQATKHQDASDAMFVELQAISLAGLIDLNQGKLYSAERTLRAALALARRQGRDSEEAAQLNNLGFVLREAGRLEAAEERFRAALVIDAKLNSIEGRAYDLRNLAVTLARQNRLAEARSSIAEALQLSRSIGNRYNELQCLIAAADILRGSAPAADGLRAYQAAADLAQQLNVPEVEWRALYALGSLHAAAGENEAARASFEAAMLAAEDLSRGRQESGTGVSRTGLYTDAMAMALQGNDVQRAFAYGERARAANVWDTLSSRVLTFPNADAEARVNAVVSAREGLRGLRHSTETPTAQRAQAEAALRTAQNALAAAYPALARAFVTSELTLAQLQSHLPAGQAVLSYFVGPKATALFVITSTSARAMMLPVGEAVLVKTANELGLGMRAFAPVDRALAQMADWLLQPAGLAAQAVTIIPHGALFRIPFAALPFGNAPLLTAMPVSYAVSAAALDASLAAAPAPRPQKIGAMSPPGTLRFADLEARAVAGDAALVGAAATLEALRSTTVDALDVAAHGTLDSRDPLASGIVLADSQGQSGRLELRSVFGLQHLPPLVTLSACETASGSDGSEWLSLAHAFWSAGAHTVVASQARVSDLGAALTMKHFYRHVGADRTDVALQNAALTVRDHLHHPGHWANFWVLGDFR